MRSIYFCLVCWFSIITTFFILCSNLIFLPVLLAQGLSPPTVSTGEATDVTSSSATLNGTSSSQRVPNAWFEYGAVSGSYDNSVSAVVTFGVSKNVWKASINGLSPATVYYYRIAANDSYPGYTTDTAYGSEKSFTTLVVTPTVRATVTMTPTVVLTPRTTPLLTPTMTPMVTATPSPTSTPCVVGIDTGDATDITSNSATLNAIVCRGTTANYMYFEYGTTSGLYTSSVGAEEDGLSDNVSAKISELSPKTTYYYRIAIQQKPVPPSSGEVYGAEKSFTTLPECGAKEIAISPNRLRLKIGKSSEVTVALGGNDCVPAGNTVTATIGKIGSKRIWVTPANQAADENGQAVFTITAMKIGNIRVTFKVDSLRKSLTVKVKR